MLPAEWIQSSVVSRAPYVQDALVMQFAKRAGLEIPAITQTQGEKLRLRSQARRLFHQGEREGKFPSFCVITHAAEEIAKEQDPHEAINSIIVFVATH